MNKLGYVAIIVVMLLVGAAIAYVVTITNTGNIIAPVTITATPNTLTWTDMIQGTFRSQPVMLTNNGGTPTVGLTMTTDLSESIGTLDWNLGTGTTIIAPTESVTAIFTLTAKSNAPTGTFSFTITISG